MTYYHTHMLLGSIFKIFFLVDNIILKIINLVFERSKIVINHNTIVR